MNQASESRPDLVERPRYDPASPMRLMAFWRGCLTAREQVMTQTRDDYERASHVAAIARIEAIMEGLAGGQDAHAMPEYARWLAHGG